jgi:poly(3-hydroxybutyrate) depolymerase
MKNIYLHKALMFLITILLSSNYLLGFDGSGTIVSGGITRSFNFHSPGTSVGSNLPMMLVFHGDGGSGTGIEAYTGFDAIADANNFLVVYPNAISNTWNRYVDTIPGDAGFGNPAAPDDVLFTADLIDYFCKTYGINPNKVYASGHSAGGFMCYDLAVQLTGKIAAFAPVSASLWGDDLYLQNYFSTYYTQVPVYHIHGDADATVPYPDPDNLPGAWSEWPLSSFSYGNCGNDTYSSTTDIVPGVKKLSFCNSGKEVYLIRIVGGGHNWPNVSGYNPAEAIWNFCNAYTINTGASCSTSINENKRDVDFLIFPNPSDGTFSINSPYQMVNAKLLDLLGNEIMITKTGASSYSFTSAPSGIYILKIYTLDGQKAIRKLIVQ